jgi:hypothetical protein
MKDSHLDASRTMRRIFPPGTNPYWAGRLGEVDGPSGIYFMTREPIASLDIEGGSIVMYCWNWSGATPLRQCDRDGMRAAVKHIAHAAYPDLRRRLPRLQFVGSTHACRPSEQDCRRHVDRALLRRFNLWQRRHWDDSRSPWLVFSPWGVCSTPISARDDERAIFELLCDVSCRPPAREQGGTSA